MGLRDSFEMKGRVAVVTGSGQGIGRGIAWGLADAGCDVVLNARRVDDLDETAAGVRERGRRALVVDGDIRDRSDELAARRSPSSVVSTSGSTTSAAPTTRRTRTLVDTPDDIFRSQLELNLTTAFQGCKAAVAHMSDGGSIINIASGAGMRGSPFTGPYAAAKAGMINMTETLSLELAPRIRVNGVAPGPVATEAFAEVR